jgi:hypothetical protein
MTPRYLLVAQTSSDVYCREAEAIAYRFSVTSYNGLGDVSRVPRGCHSVFNASSEECEMNACTGNCSIRGVEHLQYTSLSHFPQSPGRMIVAQSRSKSHRKCSNHGR